jgi:hypothetical protein
LTPVVLAVLGTTIVVWSGVVALRAMGAQATALYTSTALPLADLAQVRDGIGDARRDVRDLAWAWPTPGRRCLPRFTPRTRRSTLPWTPTCTNTGISRRRRSALLDQARAALTDWRRVRDRRWCQPRNAVTVRLPCGRWPAR